MRIAVVAETFLPQMNGVVNSVLQTLRHLSARGHETLLVAPSGATVPDPGQLHGAETFYLRSIPAPSSVELRISLNTAFEMRAALKRFNPDVVHLASPFLIGWQALKAARDLGLPTVAVYQTDVTGFAARYGIGAVTRLLDLHLARLHHRATLTLAPSSSAMATLDALEVPRMRMWGRGVDAERFHPSRRSEELRRAIAPGGERIVGYVGRLAPEKQVEDLAVLADLPGTKLVVVGDGPARADLEQALPRAHFTGRVFGEELAALYASFDLFVHTGEHETFCQTIQEAFASGVPVVATGAGGPLDLVTNSVTGWLYRPGDLDDLRGRVADLLGDDHKRRAFAASARAWVQGRTWEALVDQLIGYYGEAVALHRTTRDRGLALDSQ